MKSKFKYLLFTLIGTVFALGWFFFQNQAVELRHFAEQALTSIADLKASQIAAWMAERRADAAVVRSSRIMAQLLKTPNDPAVRSEALEYLDHLREAYHYEAIFVFDLHNAPVLTSPTGPVTEHCCNTGHVQSMPNTEEEVVIDLHRRTPSEPIHFSLLCRVKSGLETNESVIGFVLMVIDPHKFLYPFIQSWPTPSKSAETLLVRRKGQEVLYLNELRHLKDAALNVRINESHKDIPAVRAVMLKERGLIKGVDYRGVPVTAVSCKVPGTPWTMIVKIDQSEIDAPVRKGAWMIGFITGFAVLAASLGVALLLRHQRLVYVRREMNALAQSEERFRAIFHGSADGILLADPSTHRFVLCNDAMSRMTGYRSEELITMGVPDLHRATDLPFVMDGFEKHLRGEIDVLRNLPVLRKDGSVFFADVNTALIPTENGTYLGGFFRDVTDIRKAEQEVRDSRAFLDSIIDQSPISMWISDKTGTLIRLNRAYCDMMRVTPEEAINKHNLFEDQLASEQGAMPLIRSVFNEGRVVNFDLSYNTGNTGSLTDITLNQTAVMDLNLTLFPIRDSDGRITHAVVQHLDVTARKRAVERLRRLSELQAALHDPITLDQKLMRITQAVVNIFDADFARIWLTDQGDRCVTGCMHAGITEGPHVCRDRDRCLHLRASSGRYTHLDGAIHGRVPFGCYKIGRIASGLDASFLTNDVTHDPRVHNHAWAKELDLVSFAGYQLRLSHGEEIGVMGLFSKHVISPEEDAMLHNLTNLIVPAIQAAKDAEALRESEERYRGIFDESIAAIYVFDNQKRFIDSNRAGLDLLGYSRKELLDISIPDVDADRDVVLPAHAELLSGGRLVNYEHQLRRKDGSIITVLNNSRALTGPGGQVIGMQSTLFDITARKQAEIALQESRNLLKLVLNTIPQAVFWKDNESIYMGCNMTFARYAGLKDPAQIVGKTDFDLPLQRQEAEVYRAGDRAVMDSGQAKRHSIEQITQADGARLWVDTSKIALTDESGRPFGVLGVYDDITLRKQMEEDLQARNEELVRFVYTVSHDLKSPLVTIRTFLGYLEKDLAKNDSERVKEDFGYINRAAVKMNDLLDGLLELSRVGRMMNPPEALSFAKVVHEALDTVAGQIAERHVDIHLCEIPIVLHGDRLRLTEVFQNLVDNAVKFMGEQPAPRIEIGAERVDGETIFYVRDNGLGIDSRHQNKLFGLFEKLHPDVPGAGLGLALIKRIIEVHGGRIWAESAGPGYGTTFYFTLQGTNWATVKGSP